MSTSLDCLNETYEIENEINRAKIELKKLREKLLVKKTFLSKLYARSERNYPGDMFAAYEDVIKVAQGIISDVANFEVPDHKPVKLIKRGRSQKKSVNVLNDRPISERCQFSKDFKVKVSRMDWSLRLAEIKRKCNFSECSEAVVRKKSFPIWDKSEPNKITVFSPEEKKEKTFEIYKSVLTPNPFEDFMLKM